MKRFTWLICFLLILAGTANGKNISGNKEQKVPRVRFTGDAFAQMATGVFAETLQDMRNKIEYGDNSRFPAGFFHTSTEPAGVPQYYNDMWSRDCGRGLIELCRLGFTDDAKIIARYFLSHKNFEDHWGREIHRTGPTIISYELDGNSLMLSGVCRTWYVNGKDKTLGKEFCRGIESVVNWVDTLMQASPYWGLLPSISELSGNPSTSYFVYSIFGNYGMYATLGQIADMASECNDTGLSSKATALRDQMKEALAHLVSNGKFSYVPEGCWFNGIDGRDGSAYDISDWDGTAWPVWHWTRQLPFIQDFDYKTNRIEGDFAEVHQASYELLRHWMGKGEYFRKYGFVSNTGWTGMGERHDETMCGYGQGFFTQAALMADDINVYAKCLEGIARLGYDGGVIDQLSYEKNPFVMHECFNFDNYEKGLDHTFGVHKEGRREIMENPGDEGNLVQEAEIIKAFSLVAGVYCVDNKLVLMPRLPWLWDSMECRDWPVADRNGKVHYINFSIKHERWLRICTVEVSGAEGFDAVDIRFGPFPRMPDNKQGFEMENSEKGCWIWKRDLKSNFRKETVEL
jgi:hypothetical protein